jgi:hypothetical protein
LYNTLNREPGIVELNKTTATVTVKKHLIVVNNTNLYSVRAAGDIGEEVRVGKIEVKPGVTFKVDENASVTVAQGGEVVVSPADTTYKSAEITLVAASEGGTPGGIIVQAAGKIDASGPITLQAGTKLEVNEGATVEVKASAKITVPARAEVKVDGTLTVSNSATVEVASSGKVAVSGELKLATATAKVDLQGGTLEVTGKVDNKGEISGSNTGTVDIKAGGNIDTNGSGTADLTTVTTKVEDDKALTASGSNATVALPEKSEVTVVAKEGATVTKGTETVSLVHEGTAVSYGDSNALSVTFTFSKAVTAAASETSSNTWTVAPAGEAKASETITATYTGDAVPAKLGITVTDADEGTLTIKDADFYPVESKAFERASGTYRVSYYGEVATGSYVAGLKKDSVDIKYYLVKTTTENGYFNNLFNTIYTPNKANSNTDSIENGKTTVAYDATISAAVLPLFNIVLDTSDPTKDKVNLTGTGLPATNVVNPGASSSNLIIIDIGLPGVANTGLPKFYIPLNGEANGSAKGTLGNGEDTTGYGHIRLRVNNGAELVILADNSGIASGASCPPGGFKNGAVEVMSGGKLRDGAYRGFPLGSGAVLINRYGSYLSVGPEGNTGQNLDAWYYGYLIGPAGNTIDTQPRIRWTGGPGDFLEVREGKLAFSGKATVQKNMGLIYSAWFVGNSEITIDILPDDPTPVTTGMTFKGLFANDTASAGPFDFYATGTTKIYLKNGVLHKAFLTDNTSAPSDSAIFLKKKDSVDEALIISLGSSGTSKDYPDSDSNSKITGYQNWDIADTNLEVVDLAQQGGGNGG